VAPSTTKLNRELTGIKQAPASDRDDHPPTVT
jgi:hypothetical protein